MKLIKIIRTLLPPTWLKVLYCISKILINVNQKIQFLMVIHLEYMEHFQKYFTLHKISTSSILKNLLVPTTF